MFSLEEFIKRHSRDQDLINSITLRDMFDFLRDASEKKDLRSFYLYVIEENENRPASKSDYLVFKPGESINEAMITLNRVGEHKQRIILMRHPWMCDYAYDKNVWVFYPNCLLDPESPIDEYTQTYVKIDDPLNRWDHLRIDSRVAKEIIPIWLAEKIVKWRYLGEFPRFNITTPNTD